MPASKFTRFTSLNQQIAYDALEGLDFDGSLSFTNGLAQSHRRGDTHVVGSFTCPRTRCGKTWASGRIYTEIFFTSPRTDASSDHAFDVVVWKQQCRTCKAIAVPILDEAVYKERLASKLQLYMGARAPIIPTSDDEKETPPHRQELCCACKAGKCEQMTRGRRVGGGGGGGWQRGRGRS